MRRPAGVARAPRLRHEALFYTGTDDLVNRTAPFVRDALAAGEPVMVALEPGKIARLRDALGAAADRVRFADMHELGENPARILPAWRAFVDRHAASGRPVRGIGEPVWPGRPPAEVGECRCHESLLNVAFEGDDFWLVCPYDVAALDRAAVEAACATHPVVVEDGGPRPSPGFRPGDDPLAAPLDEAPGDAPSFGFDLSALSDVREFVAAHAGRAGLPRERVDELLIAVNEAASNSIRHGGGAGTARVWQDGDAVVCEVRDRGRIRDPLAGRRRPATSADGGYGLWIVNQLCSLVQLRSSADGTVVRMVARP
jgi:anti-sigma regulatory factor (Ser/Thr protein kinase)